MKKRFIVLILIMLCCMSACNNGSVNNESETADNAAWDKEETEVDAINRTIIAETLGVEENSRNIRFILSSLNTIGAGQIKSAEVAEVDGRKVINLVAEDGTDYCIYLSGSGGVEAIKNLVTGEWPIQSNR